ncbi:beta-lactamase family protein [Streptomyces sp. LX-29]|uniref:serine hydrolase domain-containing protein n=1 Tax=Streptomyces sp. LX-29 TaxID=2900152 RepID=UPI00240E07DF|nr:serine hydrolase domain-containing protein [Streptomyces sp. LX-29]WFB06441.1 beta-lactamase family protein [Streptomyces sp. LX-29]
MTVKTSALEDLVRATAEELSRGRRGAVVVGAVHDERTAMHGAAPDTLFEIGSITKSFTALALARLSLRGLVRLDEPLRELLPDGSTVPERDGRAIELAHLACHTSGLPRLPKGMFLRGLFSSDPYAACTREVVLNGLGRTSLRSVPGAGFHYSNLGAGLLGLALARRAETDYDTLIRTEICRPLGMTDTRVTLDPDHTARLTPGHSRTGRPRSRWNLAALAGAGGLHSTVPDLLRFARAQLGEAPAGLTEAIALTRATEHRVNAAATVHAGWLSAPLPHGGARQRLFFHNGGTGGYRSLLALAPDRRAAVVILSANTVSVDNPGLRLLTRITCPDSAPTATGTGTGTGD